MKAANMTKTTQPIRRTAQNLEVRYGEIGISAVAAAMRYQGDASSKTSSNIASSKSEPEQWPEVVIPEFAA